MLRAAHRHRSAKTAVTLEEHAFMYNDDHKPPRKASRKGKGKNAFRKYAGDNEAAKKRRGRDGERWQDAWQDSLR
jgi:hypothetical protein